MAHDALTRGADSEAGKQPGRKAPTPYSILNLGLYS
jgi:hypothetical protein